MLCLVEAMYSKGGGKNGKHAAVTKADNVAALSYIGLQLFEHAHGIIFQAITSQTRPFQTLTYAFIPSIRFIAMTNTLPQSMVEVSGQTVHLRSSADIKMHQTLVQNLQKLTDFIRNHGKRAPQAKAAVQQTPLTTRSPDVQEFSEDEDLGF